MIQLIDSGSVAFPAPAKLNLFLHVTGRRADGYHEIQTLFQLIDLCDEIHIQPNQSGEVVRVFGDYGVSAEQDLAVRAARLLQRVTGVGAGAGIGVNKRIPLGAGLGGGSSDAATVLLALNHLWKTDLDVDELARLGTTLGADVPVFVRGHSAMAGGIGDELQPVALGQRYYVLVFPEVAVATVDVFNHPTLVRDSRPIDLIDALAGRGRNDCQPVAEMIHPLLGRMAQELRQWGHPRLTGTGSGIFLEMADENAAINAAQEIKCRYNVRAVRGCDRSPMHTLLAQLP